LNSIILSPHFKRALRKFTNKYPNLHLSINESIKKLEQNIFDPALKTHKLSGELFGSFGCSCGYDCRIVFTIQKGKSKDSFDIILVSMGTHEEVY